MATSLEENAYEPYLALLSGVFHAQRAATARLVRRGHGTAAIRCLMDHASELSQRCSEAALLLSPPDQPVACGKGCYHCCYATVGILAPEAIHLAERLRARLSAVEFSALSMRASEMASRLRGMDRGSRLDASLPCALLRDGCCSAYESRPLVCRWACSPSLQACLDHLVRRTTPFLEMEGVRYLPTQEVWRGLKAGLHDSGLDASLLSLDGALDIALAAPDIASRYLDGEPVFAAAYLE